MYSIFKIEYVSLQITAIASNISNLTPDTIYFVETYSSSNAAALDPSEGSKINNVEHSQLYIEAVITKAQ